MSPARTATAETPADAALREGAGFCRRDDLRVVEVTGSDAAEFLQGQLTNDVEALGPGDGRYAALLDRKGHMQSDMRVLRREAERFRIVVEALGAPAVVRHLSMYRVGSDADVTDLGTSVTVITVAGPRTSELSGIAVPAGEHASAEVALAGSEVLAVTTGAGFDLLVAAESADQVTADLATRGLAEVEPEALEVIRVERGIPRFGHEMTTETIPEEAGINDRAISFTKGCYIGQETVARLYYKGKPNRHLRGLRLAGPAAAGDEVFAVAEGGDGGAVSDGQPGKLLGRIGTAVNSPRFGWIALAILRREAEVGGRVVVGESGGEAEVVAPPFG